MEIKLFNEKRKIHLTARSFGVLFECRSTTFQENNYLQKDIFRHFSNNIPPSKAVVNNWYFFRSRIFLHIALLLYYTPLLETATAHVTFVHGELFHLLNKEINSLD